MVQTKIAVTYGNNEIFQHFGRTEEFKTYEITDGKITSSEIVSSGARSHGSLAEVLKEEGIKILICGGIGSGAIDMLSKSDIKVVPGASGDPDVAVNRYLDGTLNNSLASNCIHDCSCH